MNRRRFLLSTFASSIASLSADALRSSAASAFAETAQPGRSTADALPLDLREKLMHDPLRPQFHLLPAANWMNDPCAPRYFRGQYHMFFQYNPGAAVWGDMHWAHAVSPDLIHWKHLPVALSPTSGYADAAGCFTGSVLPGMAQPTILYTGITRSSPEMETIRGEGLREVQCLATSTDLSLESWSKLDKPILDGPPPGVKVTGFRDPCPWKDGNTWYLVIGSGFQGVGGAVLLYRSPDGHNWTYLHPLAQGTWNQGHQTNPVDTGEMWECPDFFPLGGKHVLLYSTERKVYWQVGTFDRQDLRFHSEKQGLLDHGKYYAMKSMVDAKGRRVLWGWVEEGRPDDELRAAGWAGAMALPRVLTLGPDGGLRMEVPAEFAGLRNKAHSLRTPPSAAALSDGLTGMSFSDRAGEVVCSFRVGEGACRLELRAGSDVGAPVLFAVRHDGGKSNPTLAIGDAVLPLSPDEGVSTIRLWMDGSVIEVFADSREAMTARCYAASLGDIQVAWTGAAQTLRSLGVFGVKPISSDRLTS